MEWWIVSREVKRARRLKFALFLLLPLHRQGCDKNLCFIGQWRPILENFSKVRHRLLREQSKYLYLVLLQRCHHVATTLEIVWYSSTLARCADQCTPRYASCSQSIIISTCFYFMQLISVTLAAPLTSVARRAPGNSPYCLAP